MRGGRWSVKKKLSSDDSFMVVNAAYSIFVFLDELLFFKISLLNCFENRLSICVGIIIRVFLNLFIIKKVFPKK